MTDETLDLAAGEELEPSPTDEWFVPEPIGDEASPYTQPGAASALLRPVDTQRYSRLKLMKGNGKAYRMNERAMDRACRAYAQTGLVYMASAAAGVSAETLRQHRRTDEVFEEAMQDAYAEYCASLEMEAHRRAFVGQDEPIIGRVGKDEDGVIAHKRVYSDRLAELMMKRHMPNEYVERMQVEQAAVGGVLVIAAPMSEADYMARFGGRQVQPTLPILEQFRAELGLPASNTGAAGDDGMINVTPR